MRRKKKLGNGSKGAPTKNLLMIKCAVYYLYSRLVPCFHCSVHRTARFRPLIRKDSISLSILFVLCEWNVLAFSTIIFFECPQREKGKKDNKNHLKKYPNFSQSKQKSSTFVYKLIETVGDGFQSVGQRKNHRIQRKRNVIEIFFPFCGLSLKEWFYHWMFFLSSFFLQYNYIYLCKWNFIETFTLILSHTLVCLGLVFN